MTLVVSSDGVKIQWLHAAAKIRDLVTVFSSRLFNLEHYRSSTGIRFPSRLQAVAHFVTVGGAFDPHPLFSVRHYSSQASSTLGTGNALVDYLRSGAAKRLQPHPLFDPSWYAARYSHLAVAEQRDLLEHYLVTGWQEGLKPHPLFDTRWYLQTYPDIAADPGTNPLIHFLRYGGCSGERRNPNPFFETDWYFRRYPDVEAAGHNALEHYVTNGAAEGRDPSASFKTQWYRDAYPDVQALGYNPLAHYVEHGHAEGRPPIPSAPPRQLDDAYSLGIKDFLSWRQDRLDETKRAAVRHGRAAKPSTLHVVVASSGANDEPVSAVLHEGFAIAAESNGLLLSVLPWPIEDVLRSTSAEDVVLCLKDGDAIDPDGLAALCGVFHRSAQLCIFDSYWTKDDRAYPILQPGVNLPHLRAVDATFSRFALRSVLLERLLREHKIETPRDLLLRALDAVDYDRDRNAIVHCAAPVIKTPDLTNNIHAERASLIERPFAQPPRPQEKTISVVICTKDKGHLLDQLVRGLLYKPSVLDVVIVANQTSNDFAKHTLERLSADAMVSVIDYDRPSTFPHNATQAPPRHVAATYCSSTTTSCPYPSAGWTNLSHPSRIRL